MLNAFGEMQRILVLGGKSDIACAILPYLSVTQDAQIILCGRNMSTFNVPDPINKFHLDVVEIDFTNIDAVKKIIDAIFSVGDVDLVIIAYATLGNENAQLSPELYAEVLYTNFYSQALVLNQINAKMVSQGHGQILQISSVAGIRPRKVNFVYGASKFGVDFIAQGLQKMNVDKNVFISILRPGFVHTKMTRNISPTPFALLKDTVGKLAAKGLIKKKRIIYAPKELLSVMFVLKLLPERIFRIIDKK